MRIKMKSCGEPANLGHVHPIVEHWRFRHVANSSTHIEPLPCRIEPQHVKPTGVRSDQAEQHLNRCRLARAVLAQQAKDRALRHRERKGVHSHLASIPLGHPVDLDHESRLRLSHSRSPFRSSWSFNQSRSTCCRSGSPAVAIVLVVTQTASTDPFFAEDRFDLGWLHLALPGLLDHPSHPLPYNLSTGRPASFPRSLDHLETHPAAPIPTGPRSASPGMPAPPCSDSRRAASTAPGLRAPSRPIAIHRLQLQTSRGPRSGGKSADHRPSSDRVRACVLALWCTS